MTTTLEELGTSDSISLGKLGDKAFTPIQVEDSNYEDKDTHEVSEGVKITTKEKFKIDGTEHNRFHTTRKAVVSNLKTEAVRQAIANGDLGAVQCISTTFANGKNGFKLVDATAS